MHYTFSIAICTCLVISQFYSESEIQMCVSVCQEVLWQKLYPCIIHTKELLRCGTDKLSVLSDMLALSYLRFTHVRENKRTINKIYRCIWRVAEYKWNFDGNIWCLSIAMKCCDISRKGFLVGFMITCYGR